MNADTKGFDPDQIRILVVDDEDSIRKIVTKSLKSHGFETRAASGGQKALDQLNELSFDIVITDIAMPEMDGIELMQKIGEHFTADIMVMTGNIDQYTYDQFVGAGACDFIQKPFTPDEISLRVKRVLRERQLRKDLIQSHKELAQSQKFEALGQLSAGVAHEINTPIQYIADNTDFIQDSFQDLNKILTPLLQVYEAAEKGSVSPLLLDQVHSALNMEDLEYVQEELPKAIDQTLEGVRTIRNIIKAMKEFSHPGGKEHIYADLNACIKNAVTISKGEWKYIADLVLDLDETLPRVSCNPGELNQVFLNLIVNAAHAVSDRPNSRALQKGKIKIQTRRVKDRVEVSVSDNGSGIPQGLESKIFNPFFTTKGIGKGTGQGLAIARSIIVDRHKGEIDVDTTRDDGTRFLIKLPVTG